MKLIKLTLLSVFFLLFSCKNNGPESTVKNFHTALIAKNYEKAKTFTTESSHKAIDFISNGINLDIWKGELKNIDCETENNKSNCDCFIEGKEKPIPVNLIKENGEWKLDLKSSFMDGIKDFLNKFNEIDSDKLNGVMDKFGDEIKKNGDKVNDFLDNLETDKIEEIKESIDSNLKNAGVKIEKIFESIEK